MGKFQKLSYYILCKITQGRGKFEKFLVPFFDEDGEYFVIVLLCNVISEGYRTKNSIERIELS